jgi:glycosyltransferase involved in cell wall biosynthesis
VQVGIPGRRVCTILNGLSAPAALIPPETARREWNVPEGAVLIGAMGYLAPVKGFDLLIRATARLLPRHPELHLWIAGGGVMGETAMQQSLEDLIAKTCPADRVRLLGAVDPGAGFLSALDLFVISSRTEGLPLSLIQAMQHGKASVVSSAGGSAEAARPGRESLVFKSGDVADLAAQLETLITDPARRAALGHAARERAGTYLTLSRCADDYEQVYLDILSGTARSLL